MSLNPKPTPSEGTAVGIPETRHARDEKRAGRREDHELGVMPYLAAELEPTWRKDQAVDLAITAVNVSSHPALRVTVDLLRGPWDGLPPSESRATPLRETPRFYAVVPAGERRTFGWKELSNEDLQEPITVQMRYLGPLGGTVWQTYRLERVSDASFSFKDVQRYVLASVQDAKPIIT